jgi:hypothetical protein
MKGNRVLQVDQVLDLALQGSAEGRSGWPLVTPGIFTQVATLPTYPKFDLTKTRRRKHIHVMGEDRGLW